MASYATGSTTLPDQHWDPDLRVDPGRLSYAHLEYLIGEEGHVRLSTPSFGQVGSNIEDDIYGALTKQLRVPTPEETWGGKMMDRLASKCNTGVEFKCATLLIQDYRAR